MEHAMPTPIYHDLSLKLEKYIRENNISGKLPGTRTLSKMFHVHHVTLSKALHLLEDKGIITIKGTSGIFVVPPVSQHKKHNVLALVGGQMGRSWNQNILSYLGKQVKKFDYDLMGIAFDTDLFLKNQKILFNFPVDGFIFRFSSLRNEQAKLLMREKIPFVSCARRKDLPDIDQTDCDHDYGYSLLLDQLIQLGHKKIAFCEFGRIPEYQRYLREIYTLFQKKLGDNFNSDYFYVRETGLELYETYGDEYWNIYPARAVEHFLNLPEPPTAIIAPAAIFRHIYKILQSKNIRIPQDVSLMCMSYNDEIMPAPNISGIVYDEKKMLSWAAERLIRKINNPDLSPAHYIQKPIFNPGETIAPPPVRSTLPPQKKG